MDDHRNAVMGVIRITATIEDTMSDRDFWLLIRRALLIIVEAIERKYLQKCPLDNVH